MSAHTPKRLMFRANGDANSYSIIDASSNNWLMYVLLNGEHTTARQAEILERMAACWTACDAITTDELEEIAATGGMLGPREDVTRIAKQRDELLAALKHIEGVAMADEWGDLPGIAEDARAAIAKATGSVA
jgi:hypothetical protein